MTAILVKPKSTTPTNALAEACDRLKSGDRWAQVNSLRVGASMATCGKRSDLYDARSYGVALAETSYSNLRNLLLGEKQNLAETLQILTDALSRGSIPTLAVGLLVISHSSEMQTQVWEHLTEAQQRRIRFLLALAIDDPDLKQLFN